MSIEKWLTSFAYLSVFMIVAGGITGLWFNHDLGLKILGSGGLLAIVIAFIGIQKKL